MKKLNIIFPALFLTSITMPTDVFAGIPENSGVPQQLGDKYCNPAAQATDTNPYARTSGVSCTNKDQGFYCTEYKKNLNSKDYGVINEVNTLYNFACEEENTSLLANATDIVITGNTIIRTNCKPGYKHPDNVDYYRFRCVKDTDRKEETPAVTSAPPVKQVSASTNQQDASTNSASKTEQPKPAAATTTSATAPTKPAASTTKTEQPKPANSAMATTITASGTVLDEYGDPAIGASIIAVDSVGKNIKNNKNNLISTITDVDGKFKLDVPANAQLKVSYIGKKPQTIQPTSNINITLFEDNKELMNIEVVKKHEEGDTCGDKMLKDEHANKEKKGKYHKVDDEWICIPNECIQDYELKDGVCVHKECSNQELKALNVSEGRYEGGKCVVVTCKNNFHLNAEQNKCEENKCPNAEEDWINGNCIQVRCSSIQLTDANAKKGTWDTTNQKCTPECDKKYHLNPETNKCETNECPTAEEDFVDGKCIKVRCSSDELKALNAKDGKWENDKCVPTKCLDEKNFKLEDGACGANDCPAKELEKINAVSGHMENGKCVIAACKESYTLENGACINKQKLEELQKAYDEAKANEQSLENRTLTAASVAATGIGGMELMQGTAEQSADKDAMANMAAYIETMRCTYGEGKQVKAGPDEIELPGANDQELMNLRGQYLALAQDLKERKEALGMKAGIESETIMDRTQTGLYDDENVGIAGGNYASLYRAMMLGSEADQAKIDDEQKTSSNRVKGGAIAAGAGVVGSIVGNELLNGKLGDSLKNEKADENDADKEKANQQEQQQSQEPDLQRQTNDELNKKPQNQELQKKNQKTQQQKNDELNQTPQKQGLQQQTQTKQQKKQIQKNKQRQQNNPSEQNGATSTNSAQANKNQTPDSKAERVIYYKNENGTLKATVDGKEFTARSSGVSFFSPITRKAASLNELKQELTKAGYKNINLIEKQ